MKKLLIVLLAIGFTFTSCSTMFNGAKQNVSVKADVSDASIKITNNKGMVMYEGKASNVISLPRANTYTVEISLTGYQSQRVAITHGVEGWFWGNLCLGGFIGMGIDFVTGSMWSLEPNNIEVKLQTAFIQDELGASIVFFSKDDDGNLRYVSVPLIKA